MREEGKNIIYMDESYIHTSHISGKSWSDDSKLGLKKLVSEGERLIITRAEGFLLARPKRVRYINIVSLDIKGAFHNSWWRPALKTQLLVKPKEPLCNFCLDRILRKIVWIRCAVLLHPANSTRWFCEQILASLCMLYRVYDGEHSDDLISVFVPLAGNTISTILMADTVLP
ncbi:hypothetical protein EVAR_97708_1 [Eumeta japonica]|uniref:Uncharacterized protein n=1 Tax=Eumeta variegata TaxID=151549 RepID=A0A4C1XWL2_EUMVA|nr:hypothetical protein EVAR_97708_1 [Eumeta japonica]